MFPTVTHVKIWRIATFWPFGIKAFSCIFKLKRNKITHWTLESDNVCSLEVKAVGDCGSVRLSVVYYWLPLFHHSLVLLYILLYSKVTPQVSIAMDYWMFHCHPTHFMFHFLRLQNDRHPAMATVAYNCIDCRHSLVHSMPQNDSLFTFNQI